MEIDIKKKGFRDKKVDFVIKDEAEAFWQDMVIARKEDVRVCRNNLMLAEVVLEGCEKKLKELEGGKK